MTTSVKIDLRLSLAHALYLFILRVRTPITGEHSEASIVDDW